MQLKLTRGKLEGLADPLLARTKQVLQLSFFAAMGQKLSELWQNLLFRPASERSTSPWSACPKKRVRCLDAQRAPRPTCHHDLRALR